MAGSITRRSLGWPSSGHIADAIPPGGAFLFDIYSKWALCVRGQATEFFDRVKEAARFDEKTRRWVREQRARKTLKPVNCPAL